MPANPGEEVLELLRARRAGEPCPEAKLGLVIEGGGLRTVVSAAIGAELERQGFAPALDGVYGVSAGAVVGAYLCAGQLHQGAHIPYRHMTDRRFLDLRRPLRGRPIMNLDYLVEDVLRRHTPLDFGALQRCRTQLHIYGAGVRSGRVVDLGRGSDRRELERRLLAAARIPLVAGGPVRIGGDHYFDAGLLESVPFRQAYHDGCTHLVLALSRPGDSQREENHPAADRLLRAYLRMRAPLLLRGYRERARRYNRDRGLLHSGAHPEAPIPLLVLAPEPGSAVVGGQEQSRELLQAGARSGRDAARRRLSDPPAGTA